MDYISLIIVVLWCLLLIKNSEVNEVSELHLPHLF